MHGDIGLKKPAAAAGTPRKAEEAEQEQPFYKRALETPFMAYGDTVKEFTFRKPTTADIIRHGLPFNCNIFVDPPDISFREQQMFAMLETLSALPLPSIQKMSATDWVAAATACAGAMVPQRDIVFSIVNDLHCTLSAPLATASGPVPELTWRKPAAMDILAHGLPLVRDGGAVTFFEVKALRMIAALTGVAIDAVAAMEPQDFVSCLWGIAPFFVPRMEEPPPAAS